MRELISKQDAIRLVHNVLYEMRVDAAATDIEKPMSKEDKLLLKVNKIVCTKLKELPSAQPLDVQLAYYRGVNDGIEQCTERIKRLADAERRTDE